VTSREILYDWGGLNAWLFHAVNDAHTPLLDPFMLLGTRLAEHSLFPLYLGLLALAGFVATAANRQDGWLALREQALFWLSLLAVFSLSYLLDGWLVGWLKSGLDFPRPPLALPPGTVNVIGQPEFRHSLPSGHASFAALLAASVWPLARGGWKLLLALFVLWACVSRLYLGFHFPADVLAGCLLSVSLVVAVRRTLTLIQAQLEKSP
jgi:membrane-associated phospholipid phosphatase